jgi:hypothetical protein
MSSLYVPHATKSDALITNQDNNALVHQPTQSQSIGNDRMNVTTLVRSTVCVPSMCICNHSKTHNENTTEKASLVTHNKKPYMNSNMYALSTKEHMWEGNFPTTSILGPVDTFIGTSRPPTRPPKTCARGSRLGRPLISLSMLSRSRSGVRSQRSCRRARKRCRYCRSTTDARTPSPGRG